VFKRGNGREETQEKDNKKEAQDKEIKITKYKKIKKSEDREERITCVEGSKLFGIIGNSSQGSSQRNYSSHWLSHFN
jgi:hypothetical protein